MKLLAAFLRFSDRSFPWTLGNALAVAAFLVALLAAATFWPNCLTAFLCVTGLLIALAFLNHHAFLQLLHEGYGVRAFECGKYAEAEGHFRKSWARAQMLLPMDQARPRVLRWLTLATRAQGNYDDAEAFALKWVAQSEKSLGTNHPATLVAVDALAQVYETLARYGEALPLLERIVDARETRKSTEPLEYAKALDSLGSLWMTLARPERAEPYFQHAFEVASQSLDSSSREALIACGLFCLTRVAKHPNEAAALAESAVARAEKSWPASTTLADCLSVLAMVRRYQSRYGEAEEILRRSLDIRKKCHPRNPLVTHEDLGSLARILLHQGQWADAEECFRETLRLRDEYLAPTDLAIVTVLLEYAELMELMNRLDEAHGLRQRAEQILEFHKALHGDQQA